MRRLDEALFSTLRPEVDNPVFHSISEWARSLENIDNRLTIITLLGFYGRGDVSSACLLQNVFQIRYCIEQGYACKMEVLRYLRHPRRTELGIQYAIRVMRLNVVPMDTQDDE